MNHYHTTFGRICVAILSGVLSVAVAAPVIAAEKSEKGKKQQDPPAKKGKIGEGSKSQSDQARQSMEKQKQVASGLRDKALADPSTLQAMIDDLRAQLQAEEERHAAAVESNAAAAKAAGADKKQVSRAQKSASDESRAYSQKKGQLQRQIADLEKKLVAAGGSEGAPPTPESPTSGTPKVSTPR